MKMDIVHSRIQENYLKSIYLLSEQGIQNITTNRLSNHLFIRPSSVSNMLDKLKTKGYIHYEKYYGARMTKLGKNIAVQIVRRHRLWEVFLYDKLKFKWEEVHALAEELEHLASDLLIDRLEHYLNYPVSDPHGAPIPKQGKVTEWRALAACKPKQSVRLIGVKDRSMGLIQHLKKQNIALNTQIRVISKAAYDNSMVIELPDKTQRMLTEKVAENLLIE